MSVLPAGVPRAAPRVQLRILGPLEASRADSLPARLGPPRQRTVLGLLALSPNILVHREEIIDRLWPDRPPATSVDLVQAYVSRLRGALAPASPARSRRELVASLGASYRLQLEPDELDLTLFTRTAQRADRMAAAGDLAAACDLFEEALRMWRGRPLADLDLLRASPLVTALADQRSAVVMRYAVTAAGAGQAARVLPQLRLLAESEPLDERVHAALMTALAVSGQQAAALAVYAGVAARLDDQLGVRPGRELAGAHLRVLRRELGAAPETAHGAVRAAEAIRPRQLPPPPRALHGRAAQLQALTDLAGEAAAAPPVAVLSGPPGAGKTALALSWAARAAPSFPDGQLYVNLCGPDGAGAPMPPADVLGILLGSLPGAPASLPDSLPARVSLYRSLVSGRRLLIVLDQVRDAPQVRPLLPGCADCLVIVTSHARLASLAAVNGARLIPVPPLSAGPAVGLLGARLGEDRVTAEPGPARRVAGLCGGLPLALCLAAGRALTRPGDSLATLAAALADAPARLDALDAVSPEAGLRSAFSRAYRDLRPAAALVFRLLGQFPGRAAGESALARLAGLPLPETRAALASLADASLVTEPAPGRFALPRLLGCYAAEQAGGAAQAGRAGACAAPGAVGSLRAAAAGPADRGDEMVTSQDSAP